MSCNEGLHRRKSFGVSSLHNQYQFHRQIYGKKFRVSKSTVHKDVTERLLEINPGLAAEVKSVLENNKAERHLRGGMATREKYQHAKEK